MPYIISFILLGVIAGVVIQLTVSVVEKYLPEIILKLSGYLLLIIVIAVSCFSLFLLLNPYVGEIHSSIKQLSITIWTISIALGLLRFRFSREPLWSHLGPVLTKAVLTAVLLMLLWDIDLGWEYTFRQLLSMVFSASTLLTMLILDYYR